MDQLSNYGDKRTLAYCAFCSGETGTRDHCPSRVFLDEPYPKNLPVVPACSKCNAGFSLDEEYFACFISCVIAGTTNPDEIPREKTKRLLAEKPLLRARIDKARAVSNGRTVFQPEHDRISGVVIKLAQGHALFELHESCARRPDNFACVPLELMGEQERFEFENPQGSEVWPEVGSRAMQRLVELGPGTQRSGWLEVQPDRYRYHASIGSGIEIRIVIHEYIGCLVWWK